ncbi:hypothetical protein pdam_00002606 [Pocillopora damicornis]|uniref:Uncharacterized protein n=1 Tax=Pocillopora damicornis TaxID=46731 RepID=A0A3M6U342_POCDA|nr:hypothetical protein pdam_00002606 [Pocillopora damicornis]
MYGTPIPFLPVCVLDESTGKIPPLFKPNESVAMSKRFLNISLAAYSTETGSRSKVSSKTNVIDDRTESALARGVSENVILLLVLVKNADRDQLRAWYPIEITNHQFQGRPVSDIQTVGMELNLRHPRTNPESNRVKIFNRGPPDDKPSPLTTLPHCLLNFDYDCTEDYNYLHQLVSEFQIQDPGMGHQY